ncbi:maleylacetoacetate isomerase [Melittangium boletus]|uniref:Maleylacetoacetate isomerase n=1 Tax=Melittangium boletus DSM 14713 TaxID=1294270 RepID=A0A250I9K0_9BACT|nr:maleylacetoacetate isomerase [Melittangium boletus]ATB28549.1 maleylacetoacetate isomerase [Melittangium boletus DSM 14713]
MRLHNYWRSSCSWRVRIALNLKGLAFEYVPVHLVKDGGAQHTDAYRALNPMRTVPTLEFTHEGRVHFLSQSLAILEYLEERYPSPALLPADPLLRAHVRMLSEVMNSGIQPLHNLSVAQRVKAELKGDDKAWNAYWIERGLTALQALAEQTAGRYCVGDEVSFADVCLIPQLYAARRFGVDLSPYGLLTRVEAACAGLPAFLAAHADRQPDAVPA